MNKFINSSKFGDELLFISNLGELGGARLAVRRQVVTPGLVTPRVLLPLPPGVPVPK